jgi:hypothetical protein
MLEIVVPPSFVNTTIVSPAAETTPNDAVAEVLPLAAEPRALCTNTGTGPLSVRAAPLPLVARTDRA